MQSFKLTSFLDQDHMATDCFIQAITHRSANGKHNERMEFLGDSVLGLIITNALYRQQPKASEGYLSRLRASLVNENTLAEIANELSLGDFLRLGAGELKSGGFRRPSILADTVESIFGAVYSDSGFDVCRQLILHLYQQKLAEHKDLKSLKDPKTRLQELLQSRHFDLPIYHVQKISGKSHSQIFHLECLIPQLSLSINGEGKSRRKAEQHAAEKALIKVEEELRK